MAGDDGLKLLQALRDYRPPKKLHPIADKAFSLYQKGDYKVTDETIAILRADLDAIAHDIKLHTDALCGVTAFMIYINEKYEDHESGEKVADLIKSVGHRYESLTERAVAALGDLGKSVKGLFDRFTAKKDTDEKRAPAFGEERPEGTIPLSTLKPPAQPPPWARKKK
jgi:hypothetical protein